MDFDEWLKQVNRNLMVKCGLGVWDLPDWTYRDAFDDGVPPDDEDMLFDILENADYPMELF